MCVASLSIAPGVGTLGVRHAAYNIVKSHIC